MSIRACCGAQFMHNKLALVSCVLSLIIMRGDPTIRAFLESETLRVGRDDDDDHNGWSLWQEPVIFMLRGQS